VQEVKPTALRWYGIRAEQYLQAVSHQRLTEHTPQDVTDYPEKLGRSSSMAEWQYCQTVDALRIGKTNDLFHPLCGHPVSCPLAAHRLAPPISPPSWRGSGGRVDANIEA
jgi:hypothetical protein